MMVPGRIIVASKVGRSTRLAPSQMVAMEESPSQSSLNGTSFH
jgi:hypothetical protein